MTSAVPPAGQHGELMDSIYRGQRHIYDATRKYYLFGRDTLIRGLNCAPGENLLEIGCGTGRNLAHIARRWPGVRVHGLDISREMLKSAAARLGSNANLALGDATNFDCFQLFGRAGFDRVVLSFALSMIPDWDLAVRRAIAALAPGGELHIVDFGDLAGMPAPLRNGLNAWLAHFHVTPRLELSKLAGGLCGTLGYEFSEHRSALGYFQLIKVTASRN